MDAKEFHKRLLTKRPRKTSHRSLCPCGSGNVVKWNDGVKEYCIKCIGDNKIAH